MIVYKYVLDGVNHTNMPSESRVLSVGVQGSAVVLWALCDEAANTRQDRMFEVYGTGHPMPKNPGTYIGTVQDGGLVWHVFERT